MLHYHIFNYFYYTDIFVFYFENRYEFPFLFSATLFCNFYYSHNNKISLIKNTFNYKYIFYTSYYFIFMKYNYFNIKYAKNIIDNIILYIPKTTKLCSFIYFISFLITIRENMNESTMPNIIKKT